jgi:dCTP deaminase
MVKSDTWIISMARERGLIEPFEAGQVRDGVISYGVSSYGYDLRLEREFQAPLFEQDTVVDPKNPGSLEYDSLVADSFLIPPGSFVLARSLEYFRIPRDVLGLCTGKSTYARSGVLVNVTPLEPEWEGYITLNVINAGPAPVKLYAGEGAAQVIFFAAEQVCATSYADRKGKYQAARGIEQSKI